MNQEKKSHSPPTLISRIFKTYGVKPIDIPVGLLVFNGLLWVEWMSVFVIAVRHRPLRYLKIHSLRFQNLHHNLRSWRVYNGMERYTIKSANKVSQYKWFQRFGKRMGTSATDLTYGTIETIIIYNALLPLCWAPLNFVCAVTFIQFYRKYLKDDNNESNGGNTSDGSNRNAKDKTDHTKKNTNIDKNSMKMTEFLFSIKRYWLGIQPSTMCLKIKAKDQMIYDMFKYNAMA
eukprot:522289_1